MEIVNINVIFEFNFLYLPSVETKTIIMHFMLVRI